MSIGYELPELARLNREYRRICDDFDNKLISASEARDQVLGLLYVDDMGDAWVVDTRRSGRNAQFVRRPRNEHRSSQLEIPQLARLNREYRRICDDFDNKLISASEARDQVLGLLYVDEKGDAWVVDTRRSGRNAQFVRQPRPRTSAPTLTPTQPSAHTQHTALFDAERDEVKEQELQPIERHIPATTSRPPSRRSPVTLTGSRISYQTLATGIVAAVLLTLIAVVLGDSSKSDSSPASDNNPSVTTLATTPNSQPSTQTTQKPSAFTNTYKTRESVPFEQIIEFGKSVQNRPLSVIRRGTPGATRVLIVGAIHGSETAGMPVVDLLKKAKLNSNIDLWLVPTMNPDGVVANTRQNANKVDLNRNFTVKWEPIGTPGFWQYSGPSAASEPEVQAMENLGQLIRPQLTIWYHQNYFRISPSSGRDGKIRKRYAELVDLPLLTIVGGRYTGTGAQWAESVTAKNGVGFTVEFGDALREGEAQKNADAVLTIVNEFFS